MSEMKQKNVRLSPDITVALDAAAKRYGLEESELVRRALRLYLRRVEVDKDLLYSKDAIQPLENSTR